MNMFNVKTGLVALLLLGIQLLVCSSSIGQTQILDLPQFIPPSPNSASLGKYGDIPIGKYTGTANVSIPLYDLKMGKFSLPINLNYTTSGLKVEEQASWVGLGWSLNAGGLITRTVHGKQDEGPAGYWHYAYMSDSALMALSPGYDLSGLWVGSYDLEPDMFYFNFAGKSGKFIIDADSLHTVHCIPYQNLRIQHNNDLTSFTITDENGNIFTFDLIETTLNALGEGTSYNSSWYLTKIVTTSGTMNLVYNSNIEYNVVDQVTQVDYTRTIGETYGNKDGGSNFTDIETSGKVISQIITADQTVTFYSSRNRKDITSGSILDSVAVTDLNGTIKKRFSLSHSYFGNAGSSDWHDMRLKLDNVIERSCTDPQTKPYYLQYYSPSLVPPLNSMAQDWWGFYNGALNSTLLPPVDPMDYPVIANYLPGANRDPVFAKALCGTLQSITYPTGGSTTFIYEGNDYSHNAGGSNLYKDRVLTTVSAQAIDSASHVTMSSTANFHLATRQNVKVAIVGHYSGPTPVENGPTVILSKVAADHSSTNLILTYMVNTGYTNYIQLDTGNYSIQALVDGSVQEASIAVSYYTYGTGQKNWPIGGVRIRQVINADSITGKRNIKTYTYRDHDDTTYSSGTVYSLFNFVEVEQGFLIRSSYSASYLGVSQGSNVSYAVVTESESTDSAIFPIGKTESYYNTYPQNLYAQDYVVTFPIEVLGTTYIQTGVLAPTGLSNKISTDYDVYRGNLLEEVTYNSLNAVVKKTIHNYSLDSALNPTFSNYISLPARRGYYFVSCPNGCTQCNWPANSQGSCNNSHMDVHMYKWKVNSPWIFMVSTIDTTYSIDGSMPVGTMTNYYYDNPVHALVTRTVSINSKGDTLKTINKYPGDQSLISGLSTTAGNALTRMVSVNKISPPIEISHYKNSTLLDVYRTDYKIWDSSRNIIEPEHIWYGTLSASLEDRIDYSQYDTNSNVLQLSKANDQIISYIWDYKKMYPIAMVSNGSVPDIAYTSFEAEGTGNWIITGGTINTTSAITGSHSYTISPGASITKSGLSTSRRYLVTYWSKNGPLTISGTSATAGLIKRGWTYYEHLLLASSTSVSISGSNITLDELRLYPTDAQMKSVTYTPLYGESSVCASNNLITYYEYDGLGRLLHIRDIDSNVIKKYQYQYLGAPSSLINWKQDELNALGFYPANRTNIVAEVFQKSIDRFNSSIGDSSKWVASVSSRRKPPKIRPYNAVYQHDNDELN